MMSERGREKGARIVQSKIDNRYFAVKSLRESRTRGMELNPRTDDEQDQPATGFLQDEDERWLRNYNIHSLERKVNVSVSFNPRSGLCYTCLDGVHQGWEGKNGETVVFVICDQAFPANCPALDGGECLRVVRVEDGSLYEIVGEFLLMVKGKRMAPGTVIMLGICVTPGQGGHWVLLHGVGQMSGTIDEGVR